MKRRTLITGLTALALTLSACGLNTAPLLPDTSRTDDLTTAAPESRSDTPQAGERDAAPEPRSDAAQTGDLTAAPLAAHRLMSEAPTLSLEAAAPTEDELSALSRASTTLLYEAARREDSSQNVLLSPVSILMALGMTENGARGDTLSQLEQSVNGGLSIHTLNPLLRDLSGRLQEAAEVDWNVANSIWFREDGRWEILEDFASVASSCYGAQLWSAPFDLGTVRDINQWVCEETRGMIPDILSELSEDVRMVLINALAFEGEWRKPYEETDILEGRSFTNADGSTSEVTMLVSEEQRCFVLGDGIGFLKPYRGGAYSFVGILPEEGMTPVEYLASLAALPTNSADAADAVHWDQLAWNDLAEAVRNCPYGKAIVQLPEFSLDYGTELIPILQTLGAADAFDPGAADFSGMMRPTTDEMYELWIGNILHKTHIEVDRAGTRAAAATAVLVNEESSEEEQPVYIRLDRPFLYAIVENETGLPIFLGYINTME